MRAGSIRGGRMTGKRKRKEGKTGEEDEDEAGISGAGGGWIP